MAMLTWLADPTPTFIHMMIYTIIQTKVGISMTYFGNFHSHEKAIISSYI